MFEFAMAHPVCFTIMTIIIVLGAVEAVSTMATKICIVVTTSKGLKYVKKESDSHVER
jgi:hypothetical protein